MRTKRPENALDPFNPSAAPKPWKITSKLVLRGFLHPISDTNSAVMVCSFHRAQHWGECTDVAPSGQNHPRPPLQMTSPGGPVKHPVYKLRAETVSKLSRGCVTSYPPQGFGSSRQEMKGKMVVKWVLLMTHQETWHSERSSLELIPQHVLTWAA